MQNTPWKYKPNIYGRHTCKIVSVGIMNEYIGMHACNMQLINLIMNISLNCSMDIGDIEGWDTEWFS